MRYRIILGLKHADGHSAKVNTTLDVKEEDMYFILTSKEFKRLLDTNCVYGYIAADISIYPCGQETVIEGMV
jgi:hypothetical protein